MPFSLLINADRKFLERDGDEVARATSLVRNAPNSSLTTHQNDLGKEFFVHEGVFEDEHVQYAAGTYSGEAIRECCSALPYQRSEKPQHSEFALNKIEPQA